MKIGWLIILGISSSLARAGGDSVFISRLLRDIASRQVVQDGFYYVGTFPGTRIHASRPQKVSEDNNIFFSGLIAMGLRNIRGGLAGADRDLCDSITARARRAYPYYQNRKGRMTFNFWPTNPPVLFPGDPVLVHLKHSHALPDDLDDSSILLDNMDLPDSTLRRIKALMEAHANGLTGTLHTGYSRYKRAPAYSTWYGKRMPIDMDCSVLCNILYWVCRNRLPFSRVDSASIVVLKDMIVRELPWRDPAFVSPHYSRTPVILYHIGRLLGSCSIAALDSLKPLLLSETRAALAHTDSYMDQVLLSSTLLRLGAPPASVPAIVIHSMDEDDASFVFFIASFSDYFRNPFRRIFLQNRFIRYEFRSVAYNRFLLLEYMVLRQQAISATTGN
jgi:hypothetical protein